MSDPSGATDLASPAEPADSTPSGAADSRGGRGRPAAGGSRNRGGSAGTRRVLRGPARPWLFVAPVLLALAVVIGYPVVRAVIMSFQKDSGLNEATGMFEEGGFAGFDNYTHWLLQQCTIPGGGMEPCPTGNLGSQFWVAIGITLLFTVVTVTLEATIGLGMATVMGKTFRGRALLRAAVLIPWAIPTAVTARLWEFMFQYDGVVNRVLGTHILWQTDPWWSRFAVIIADVWKTTPFMALLILAGLQVIPNDVYEAARVDGASAWQRFTQITLPLVKPALLVAVLFRTMDALRLYDLPAIMTQGNPATRTISILVVDQVRQGQNGAAALSVLTFLLIFAVAFVLVKVLGANAVATQEEQRRAR